MAVTKAQYSAQSAELITKLLSTTITQPEFKTQWADLNNAYGVSNPELADKQGKFIDESQELKKDMYDWATGTVNGGPNHDGMYPIKLVTGGTVFWPCIARIIDPLYGSETQVREYAERAEAALASFLENTDNSAASAATALAAAQDALASEQAAATSKTQADAARSAAELARDQALTAKADSEIARNASQAAKAIAVDARDAAALSAAGSDAAKSTAVSAMTAAEAAKGSAEAAKTATDAIRNATLISADEAAQSALDAGRAKQSALVALSVAEAAAADAQTAATTATDAMDAAVEASNDADDAQAIAVAARDAALAAQQAAEDAAQDAAEAIGFDINAYQSKSEKGVANGYATLNASGKVPIAQLDTSAFGGFSFQGTWNATTNTIPAASSSNRGWYFKVSVAGSTSVNGVTDWQVGDLLFSNGSSWEKIDNTDQISTVAGRKGDVVLTKADVGLSSVDNSSDANKPVSTATQTALNLKLDASSKATNTDATTGSDDTKYMTAAKTAVAISGATITPSQVSGLTATLAAKQATSERGLANGYASLDSAGRVPAAQLDIQWANVSGKPSTFAPSTHTHAIADVTGLQTALDAKLPLANAVTSVMGRTGDVVLTKTDLGLERISQVTDVGFGGVTGSGFLGSLFEAVSLSGNVSGVFRIKSRINSALNLALTYAPATGLQVYDAAGQSYNVISTANLATQAQALAGTDSSTWMTPLTTAQAIGGATITQTQVSGLSTALAGKVADGDALKSDRQLIVTPAITGGVMTLDLSQGAVFNVSWNANITSINVTNCPSGAVSWTLVLVGAGGTSVSWNTTTFKFPGGTAPTLINTAGAHNVMSMFTLNAASRVNVFFSGATI